MWKMDNVWDCEARGGGCSPFCCRNNDIKTHARVEPRFSVREPGNLWREKSLHGNTLILFVFPVAPKNQKVESLMVPGSAGMKPSCLSSTEDAPLMQTIRKKSFVSISRL